MSLRKLTITVCLGLATLGGYVHAEQSERLVEAPSTVNATYVSPSAERMLQPGEKIDSLFTRNSAGEYVLQRLTERTYWVQNGFYSTTFYVGDEGVLLFDPLGGGAKALKAAIVSVTNLPITTVVYSHDHADHAGDGKEFVAAEGEQKVRFIASAATASKMKFLGSALPEPTKIVKWPNGSFKFEDLKVKFHGFDRAAHTDDHGIWLLEKEGVAHIPDLINPDQPPFWAFGGSEAYVYYKANIEELAALEWDFFNGGHGNIGARSDIEFYRTFLADLEEAVGSAMGSTPWGTGVDASKINAHTAFLPAWLDAIAKKATDELRPKYGDYYGFESATPRNAEMVAMALFDYK